MRGQQLTRLLVMLRAETSRSMNVSVGVDDAQNLTAIIQRTQETLYDDFDWPHLRQTFPAIPLQAGQRYYDFPENLNYDRIESAALRLNGLPIKFTRGIEVEHYGAFDSDAGVRSSLPLRYDIRSVNNADQMEIWPIPADNTFTVQFTGIRKLRRLVDSDDVADIDDRLITLFAAAEVLTHAQAPDSKMKLAAAQQLYARLKGRSAGDRPTIRLGMGSPSPQPYRATVVIGGR